MERAPLVILSASSATTTVLSSGACLADNPIIQTKFTADPAPMAYEDTLYLYTSHDEDNATGVTMYHWIPQAASRTSTPVRRAPMPRSTKVVAPARRCRPCGELELARRPRHARLVALWCAKAQTDDRQPTTTMTAPDTDTRRAPTRASSICLCTPLASRWDEQPGRALSRIAETGALEDCRDGQRSDLYPRLAG